VVWKVFTSEENVLTETNYWNLKFSLIFDLSQGSIFEDFIFEVSCRLMHLTDVQTAAM